MILRSLIMVLSMAFAVQLYAQQRVEARQATPYGTDRSENHQDIQLYPNPAPDYVYVKLGTLKSQEVEISVLNVIGSELIPEVETIDEHEIRVRVKEMAPGYYFLAIKDEATRFKGIYKFLKP